MATLQAPRVEKVAVLLNANARRVTPAMVKSAEAWVGSQNVYFSHSLEEAETMVRRIIRRRYTRVICGGGDGTLVTAVNMFTHGLKASNTRLLLRDTDKGRAHQPQVPPAFGLMCLGTGNALRRVVGATSPMRDLKSLTQQGPHTTLQVPLIEARDNNGHTERFLFAGIGHDAMALHDYNAYRASHPPLLRPLASNVAGYAMAMLSRTVPRWLTTHKPLKARIVSRGPAYYLDPSHRDKPVALPAGSELYNGRVDLVGVSTVPYLGYSLRMFPFAKDLHGSMQLRVARLSPFRLATNLLPIWTGTYRNKTHVKDFLVSDVEIILNKPFRYQHSGEDRGLRQRVHFKVAKQPLTLTLPNVAQRIYQAA